MSGGAKVLILGITLGAVGVVLALRIRQVLDDRDPDVLVDRIAGDLKHLESQLSRA